MIVNRVYITPDDEHTAKVAKVGDRDRVYITPDDEHAAKVAKVGDRE